MKFNSKEHMIQELLKGKQFKQVSRGGFTFANNNKTYYDSNSTSEYGLFVTKAEGNISLPWFHLYEVDVWEEITDEFAYLLNESNKKVICYVSNYQKEPDSLKLIAIIDYYDEESKKFKGEVLSWKYASPVSREEMEELTY